MRIGPQAHARRLDRRLERRPALLDELLGELDDQDRVLRRQADGREQPDLEVDVVGRWPTGRDHRAEHAERHASMTATGIDQLS
jgi:hypothetical protein